MKNNVLISAVLAAALLPAVGMSDQKVNNFEKDGQNCDSWAWQDDMQSVSKQNSASKQSTNEQLAFGDDTHYGIGW
jgi:hypothetical protein